MFVGLRGEPYLLWRAVDEHGAELDILLQEKRRDKAAAKRFFKRVLRSSPGRARSSPISCVAIRRPRLRFQRLAGVKHVFVKAAARLNNRAENSHQSTRERERRMRGFRDPKRTQAFLLELRTRSGNTSRLSGICCALHCIANSLQQGSLRGANSPK